MPNSQQSSPHYTKTTSSIVPYLCLPLARCTALNNGNNEFHTVEAMDTSPETIRKTYARQAAQGNMKNWWTPRSVDRIRRLQLAGVAELVDASHSKCDGETLVGSSPTACIQKNLCKPSAGLISSVAPCRITGYGYGYRISCSTCPRPSRASIHDRLRF